MKESTIEAYLLKRVKALGGECRKVNFPGHLGAPDRFVLLPGHTPVWVELKSPTGRLTPAQVREHVRLCKMGETVITLRSKEEVDAWLKTL